jgi:hypothetical protein
MADWIQRSGQFLVAMIAVALDDLWAKEAT